VIESGSSLHPQRREQAASRGEDAGRLLDAAAYLGIRTRSIE
jgi:hypothetical protein